MGAVAAFRLLPGRGAAEVGNMAETAPCTGDLSLVTA